MQIDLSELTQLGPIFRELFKGFHISRRDPELYSQLSNQQDQYRALFRSLGFELVCDTRGFYYFVPEQIGAQVNKTAQRLALFTFILVEHLADQGRDPLAVLDGGSIGRDELPPLLEKYRDLFLQAEVTTQEELEEKVMRRMTQLGFAAKDNGVQFFVALPHSTIDWTLDDGSAIPIEERDAREVTHMTGQLPDGAIATVAIAPDGSPAANYAFDVTPARLITGFITERGVTTGTRDGLAVLYPEHRKAAA